MCELASYPILITRLRITDLKTGPGPLIVGPKPEDHVLADVRQE